MYGIKWETPNIRTAARAYLSATLEDNGIDPAKEQHWLDTETDALTERITDAVGFYMSTDVAPLPDTEDASRRS